jgi:hypothetical protein
MKIKQVVHAKYSSAYCGWNHLEFTDAGGDEISIEMTDDQYLQFGRNVADKVERIERDRADELRNQLQKQEAADE